MPLDFRFLYSILSQPESTEKTVSREILLFFTDTSDKDTTLPAIFYVFA